MGDLINDYIDAYEPEYDCSMEPPTWSTKNGEYIPIKSMKTSHIENCVKLLRKKGKEAHESYLHLVAELSVRHLGL